MYEPKDDNLTMDKINGYNANMQELDNAINHYIELSENIKLLTKKQSQFKQAIMHKMKGLNVTKYKGRLNLEIVNNGRCKEYIRIGKFII